MDTPKPTAAGNVPPILTKVPPSIPPVLTGPVRRTSKTKMLWWLIPCLLIGILFLRGIGTAVKLNGNPEVQALRSLCALNLSSQVLQAQDLCTARGLGIARQFADSQGKFGLATFRIISLKANPSLTDIQMTRDTADGKTILYARMVDQNGWKFDDIYIVEAKGQALNVWVSDVIDHPFATALQQVDWNKAFATANNILDFCQKFKQTFGDDPPHGSDNNSQ